MHSIALQIPISQVDTPSHTIGIWSAADRHRDERRGHGKGNGPWVQVSRLGNPLINEVVIPTGLKDLWNRSTPAKDAQFVKYYKTPILAAVINKLYTLGVPTDNRDDLVQVLLTGIPKVTFTGSTPADELRINLSVPVTPAANQSRLGVLGGDNQGWPNGRRLNDDVVDIAEQAVGGFLLGHKLPLGDGVDSGDTAPMSSVPLRRRPVQRSRRHARAAEVMTQDAASRRRGGGGHGRRRPPPRRACAETDTSRGLSPKAMAHRDSWRPASRPATPQALVLQLQAGLRSRPDERSRPRPARARLPAARPRDGRPVVLREVRTACCAARCGSPRTTSTRPAASPRSRSRATGSRSRSTLGRQAAAISPTTARNYGVVGDALVELGRYRAAFHAFDTMARLQAGRLVVLRGSPTRASCSATSTARTQALLLARDAAADEKEPLAWTEMAARQARARAAGASPPRRLPPRGAAARSPATSTRSTRWRRSRSRAGDLARATALERRAVDTIPLPQFVGLYGDLLHATGHERAARVQYATEDGIRRLLAANGVRTDLETALFDVDHGIRLRRLARARAARRSASGRRSTATTCSRGRSRGTAAAARRCTTRSSRCGSARRTAPSSSTAPRSSAASATTRARGRAGRSRSTRTSPCSGPRP